MRPNDSPKQERQCANERDPGRDSESAGPVDKYDCPADRSRVHNGKTRAKKGEDEREEQTQCEWWSFGRAGRFGATELDERDGVDYGRSTGENERCEDACEDEDREMEDERPVEREPEDID